MKGIIEQEIEKYADRTGEYPEVVEVSQKEWDTLQKELKTELKRWFTNNQVNLDKDINTFRGCRLVLNRKLSKFIVR